MQVHVTDQAIQFLRARLFQVRCQYQDTIDTLTWLEQHPEAVASHVQIGAAFVSCPDPVEVLVEQKQALRGRISVLEERIRVWGQELAAAQVQVKA